MQDTAGEVRTNSQTTFSYGPLHTDVQMLDNQREFISNCSAQRLNVVWKTCRKQWMIETNAERGSGISMQVARVEHSGEGIVGRP